MKHSGLFLLTLSLSLSLLTGCASTSMHTPEPVAVNEKMVLKEFETSSSVTLINAASEADKKKWTTPAIAFLSEQLEQRGGVVAGNSALVLNVEVARVKRITAQIILAPLMMPEGCEVAMRVKTGDGYVGEYTENVGAYYWQKACDVAVTKTIVGALNDPKVRGYLQLSDK